MGKEVETKEEPEAAALRGSIRRIAGILDSMNEQGAWNLSTEAAVGQIRSVVDEAMKRPATNGPVIDELYRKIAKLEAAAVDHGVDVRLLSTARLEVMQLKEIVTRQGAEVGELRRQLVAAQSAQSSAIDLAEDARTFLAKLADNLGMVADLAAPLKPEIAKPWAERLRAIAGKDTR